MPQSKKRKNSRGGQGGAEQAAGNSPLRDARSDISDLDDADEQLPLWYRATMVAMLLLGLLWIVLYYLIPGGGPISAIGGWNIVIGFGLGMTGLFMLMKWK